MITVPIVENFDHSKIIGSLTVNEAGLPPSPEFEFSIGYRVNSDGSYKLVCVSPIPIGGAAAANVS